MRIIKEDTGNYIHSLVASITRDPASLSAWKCLHLHPQQPESINLSCFDRLRAEHRKLDCDVVRCADNDILIISRSLNFPALENLAAALTSCMVDIAPELAFYDLFEDWREVRALLLDKSTSETLSAMPNVQGFIAGENPLRTVFASTTQHRKTRKSHYVMIVEDDPMTRRMVSNAFKEQYAVVTAANAQDAVANYLLYAPDIVFLDISLPDASGFDVLKDILAVDPDAYVVMFSGNSYLDNVTSALNTGAAGFVAKPFKKENLVRYVEDSLMHHRKQSL